MWDHTDNFWGFPLIQKWTLTLSLITPIYSPLDLLTSRAFERVARQWAKRDRTSTERETRASEWVLPHQTRKPCEHLWESLTLHLLWPNPFDAGLERLKSLKQQYCEIHFGLNYALARGVVSSFSESLIFWKKLSPVQKETGHSQFTHSVPQDFLYLFIEKLMQ